MTVEGVKQDHVDNSVNKPKTVWGLFKIENQYYQPDNNLEMLWNTKPTKEDIARDYYGVCLVELDEDTHELVTELSEGRLVTEKHTYDEYRIQEVPFRQKLPSIYN